MKQAERRTVPKAVNYEEVELAKEVLLGAGALVQHSGSSTETSFYHDTKADIWKARVCVRAYVCYCVCNSTQQNSTRHHSH